jgi:zinc transport system substrate-binding protein
MRFFFLFVVLIGCSSPVRKGTVLVSLAPYQLFVKRIVKDLLNVQAIVPPGMDAHTFEPTPRQRKAIQEGRLWFQMGETFERALRGLNLKSVLLISLEGCCQDRHLWMSPKLAQEQVRLILQALCEEFPEHTAEFTVNSRALLEELSLLDQKIARATQSIRGRTLLVSHPSFGYFCSEYGLEQWSVEVEGKDPRPKHLEYLLQAGEGRRSEIIAIGLPQYNNKGLQMVANRLQIPIIHIDPYREDYFAMMEELLEQIVHD